MILAINSDSLSSAAVLTFEHLENLKKFGYDKVIMLAGGIGSGKQRYSKKIFRKKVI